MNEQRLRFRVGIFVLIGIVLLAALISMFSGVADYFRSQNTYTILFRDVSGIDPGTPVRLAGIRVGEVKRLELDRETGQVRVVVGVDKKYQIRKSDRPTPETGMVGGDTTIDFIPPAPDEKVDTSPAEPGSEFVGQEPAGVRSMLAQAAEVLPTTREAINDIRKSIKKYEQIAPTLEDAAKEIRDLAKASRDVVPSVRQTSDELRELAKATREIMPSFRKTSDQFGDLAKASRDVVPELRRTNDEIMAASKNWGKLAERMNVFLETNNDRIEKSIENLNLALSRLANVINDENQRNLAQALRNVRAGTDQLDSIAKNTNELIQESRKTVKGINDSVTRTNEVMANLQQATKPLAERSDSISRNLDDTLTKLSRTLDGVMGIVNAAGQGDGTLKRILCDPSLYDNLNEAACQISRAMPRLDRIMKDVEVFADKIARHPESLGVGGAVRPSAGIKEGPSSWRH